VCNRFGGELATHRPRAGLVERANGGEERLLHDVLRRGGVADDEQRGPVGARPVAPEEPLERFRRPSLRLEDPAVLVRRTYVDTFGRSREVPR